MIKNREEIIEQLVQMIKKLEIECNLYQTDIYAYYDKETGIVTLDEYMNVGGNSWRNDDHFVVYIDKQHYETVLDFYFESINDIADALDMTERELFEETKKYSRYINEDAPIEDIEDYHLEICKYVKSIGSYMETLNNIYASEINTDWMYAVAEENIATLEHDIKDRF